MVADIINNINMGSIAADDTGSGLDVGRITRKSVFVRILSDASGAGNADPTVNIDASYNDSEWFTLDTKAYSSGTTVQTDVFSYNSHFPWMKTALTNVSGTVNLSTIITGRGV